MGAADCFDSRLRKSEVFHFAFRNQLLDSARDVLNRDIGIDAMLIQHVDDVSLEAFKRSFYHFLDVFRPAVEASTALARPRIDVETELGGDHDLFAYGNEGFAHEFFICKWTISFGGIEQRDPRSTAARISAIDSDFSFA